MTDKKLLKLLVESSNCNPYSGFLNENNNILAAIELAELMRQFALDGHSDEAMNIDVEQYDRVINILKETIIK